MTTQQSPILILVTALIFTATSSAAAPTNDVFSSEEIAEIEKFVGDVMGCANIPGLTLGVVRGSATFSTGHGVANMATGQPVDKRTLFNLGSTSKAFVPYILAEVMNGKENHNGRIQWNSTLKEILRHDLDIEVPHPWAEMTLKDMLIYKSGISAADITTMVGLPEQVTREEIIRRLRFIPESSTFLSSNHHSNIMYTVAGHLAERITGMSWAELMRIKVFNKLSMNATLLLPDRTSFEDSALPYWFNTAKPGEPFVEQHASLFNLSPFLPIGSLMASADELTKWMRHLIHNINSKGNDSGVNMLVGDAFNKGVNVPSNHKDGSLTHHSEVAIGYGMGWFASTYRGQRRFKFSGGLYGYNSHIWFFPDSMSAIVVAVNGPGNDRARKALEGILYQISDVALRKPAWVNVSMACCCQEAEYDYEDHKETIPAELKLIKYLAPIEKYIGKYGHGLVGDLSIEPNEAGILILKLGRNLVGELTPGVTESKLKFIATSPLMHTEEWSQEKTMEFLYSSQQAGSGSNNELYDKVRIYMTDHLFYEFSRGKLFESLLMSAEEEDQRRQEELKELVHGDHHGEHRQRGNTTDENDDTHKDDVDNHEGSNVVNTSDQGEDAKSEVNENGIKSSSTINPEVTKKRNPDEEHTYDHDDHDSQGDEPVHENTNAANKFSEADKKTPDQNKSSPKSKNGSSLLQTFSVFTFIINVYICCIVLR